MARIEIPEEDFRAEALREAIAGQIPGIAPSLALASIAALSIDVEEKINIFQEVLADPESAARIRAMAVVTLARLAGERSIEPLLTVLDRPELEDEVAMRVVYMLGCIAGPEQLERLDALKETAHTEDLKRKVEFARALIVHRFRLADVQVDLPIAERQSAPRGIGALPFVSQKLSHPRHGVALDGLRSQFPSVSADEWDVSELQCGPQSMIVAVQRRVVSPDLIQATVEKPALVAIVATYDMEAGDYSPALVALLRPGEAQREVALLVARLTGEPIYFGAGRLEGDSLTIELASAQVPGVASIAARAHISAGQTQISGHSARRAIPGQPPPADHE